jgi:RNA polymerase sigma factor (sigma-70 family)
MIDSTPVEGTVGWPAELVELYDQEWAAFVRLAYLLTSNREVAEELVQDAFLFSAPRWSQIERPKSYVRAAVVNRSRSWLRRIKLDRERSQPDPEFDQMHPDELWDALGRLDERRRAAIVLRFYQDLPDVEIAEMLDCRPATVRSLIHRALRDLRQEVTR